MWRFHKTLKGTRPLFRFWSKLPYKPIISSCRRYLLVIVMLQPSMHAPSFPSHSHSVDSSTNPANQPLDSASRLSCDGDLQIQFQLLRASAQQHQLFPIFYIILCYKALVVKVLPMIQFGRMRTWSNSIIYVHQHHNRLTLILADILNVKDITEAVLQYLSVTEFAVHEKLPSQILKKTWPPSTFISNTRNSTITTQPNNTHTKKRGIKNTHINHEDCFQNTPLKHSMWIVLSTNHHKASIWLVGS